MIITQTTISNKSITYQQQKILLMKWKLFEHLKGKTILG
jgi:hypothetical protein